jgi:hypothetical protein
MQSQAELSYADRRGVLAVMPRRKGFAMSDPAFYRAIARYCRTLLREGGVRLSPELSVQLQQWALECDRQADRLLKSAPIDDVREQARRHRLRAEEYRAVAAQMQTSAARASYQHLAASYEAMARRLEAVNGGADGAGEEAG